MPEEKLDAGLCKRCRGFGTIVVDGPEGDDQAECPDCKGTGWAPEEGKDGLVPEKA